MGVGGGRAPPSPMPTPIWGRDTEQRSAARPSPRPIHRPCALLQRDAAPMRVQQRDAGEGARGAEQSPANPKTTTCSSKGTPAPCTLQGQS